MSAVCGALSLVLTQVVRVRGDSLRPINVCNCGYRYGMEAMLNAGGVDVKVSTDGVWNKICLAFPILGSNVRASYMFAE